MRAKSGSLDSNFQGGSKFQTKPPPVVAIGITMVETEFEGPTKILVGVVVLKLTAAMEVT